MFKGRKALMMLWKQCTWEAIVISSCITIPTTSPWVSSGHGYFLQSTSRTKQLSLSQVDILVARPCSGPLRAGKKRSRGYFPWASIRFFPEKGPHEAGLYFHTVFLSLFSSIHNILFGLNLFSEDLGRTCTIKDGCTSTRVNM